jgi:predicted GNAT family acetyltransferase
MIEIIENPAEQRYEARLDGELAGFAQYRDAPGRRIFTHTEVDDAFEGRGVGSRLAAAALDDARGRGLRVVPRCPFIAAYIERHPDYADLVG